MRILYHDDWVFLCQFYTNSGSSNTFEPSIILYRPFYTNVLRWDLGDGTQEYGTTITHTYSDSTVRLVRVWFRRRTWDNLIGIFLEHDNIYGTLDLSWATILNPSPGTGFWIIDNPDLEEIIFPVSPSGVTADIQIQYCPKITELDLTGFPAMHQEVRIHNNIGLTTLTFNASCDFQASFLDIYNNTSLTELDLSMANAPMGSTSFWNLYGNTSMTSLTLPSSINGTLRDLEIYDNTVLTSLDISAFDKWTDNAYIYLYNNTSLGTLTLPSTFSGRLYLLRLDNSNRTGTIDLSVFDRLNTSSGSIWLYNNSGLTGITFASSIDGTLNQIFAYSCNLTGTLDISMFTVFASDASIRLYSNANLTNITMPSAATGSFFGFIVNNCDFGYINFTGIPDALKINSADWRLQNNAMTATEVNHILVDLATLVSGESVGGDYTGRIINIGGTNADPDSTSGGYDGLAAKTALEGKGIIVNIT